MYMYIVRYPALSQMSFHSLLGKILLHHRLHLAQAKAQLLVLAVSVFVDELWEDC